MKDYLYCPMCGQTDFNNFDDRRYVCADCDYTFFANTAAAVSAVIWQQGRIALITRATEPGEGLLDLPGGYVEPFESIEDAVLREVREETGIEAIEPRFLFSVPNRYSYHGIVYNTVDIFFECVVEEVPRFKPNDEALALHWRRPQDVDPLTLAFQSVRLALDRLEAPAD